MTAAAVNTATVRAHFVGGGIGSLAAAAFMIRDGKVPGENISIYEAMKVLGGALDGAGNAIDGYRLRGGRMLTSDNYECVWDLFKTIPSLENPSVSMFDETMAFNKHHVPHAQARLVDRNGHRTDVTTMGFTMADRLELVKITEASEEELGSDRITDWLSPPFFNTNFWFMWQTTFAFQPWLAPSNSSATCTGLCLSSRGLKPSQASSVPGTTSTIHWLGRCWHGSKPGVSIS